MEDRVFPIVRGYQMGDMLTAADTARLQFELDKVLANLEWVNMQMKVTDGLRNT